MSWAKHNVEAWQAVEVAGVLARFNLNVPKPTDWITRERLEDLQDNQPEFWTELCDWAAVQIREAEAAHHADLIDKAVDR